jgi:hypothetical protein
MGYIVPLFIDMDEITFQELCMFIHPALFFVLCTILPIFCLHIKLFDILILTRIGSLSLIMDQSIRKGLATKTEEMRI